MLLSYFPNRLKKSVMFSGVLIFVILVLLVSAIPKTFAAYNNTYPWGNAACYNSGVTLGQTNGTGYWCSNYNWGEANCPPGDGFCSGNIVNGYYMYDQFGEGFRNCVSYTAWQLSRVFGINISNWGNGAQWNNSAINAGYTDDSGPQVGDIAQWDLTPSNKYGHVAYVYAVNGGVASYSELNYGKDGNYLDSYTSSSQGLPNHWIHIGTVTTQSDLSVQSNSTLYTTVSPGSAWENNSSSTYGYWKLAGSRLAKFDGNNGLIVSDNPTASSPTWSTVWGTNIDSSGQAFSIGPDSYTP